MTKRTIQHAGGLLLIFCLLAGTALAETVGFIDAGNSTKLHLRAEPSYSAESMGLFFTGTEVEVLSEENGWVRVNIGVDTGYMDRRYVRIGEDAWHVQNRQPTGYVRAKNYANVRLGPSTEYMLVDTVRRDGAVKVLGETDEHWYFVDTGREQGYISTSLVRLNQPESAGVPDGFAVIDSGGSKRLHLRAEPTTNADSLGLYFAGTRVQVDGYVDDWTKVTIGTETGYMASRYLKTGAEAARVHSKQPLGYIKAKNGANLRTGPSSDYDVAGVVERGSFVTVLGETHDHWYYVQADSRFGYISRNLISLDGPPADEESWQPERPQPPQRPQRPTRPTRPTRPERPQRPAQPTTPPQQMGFPANLPQRWYFSSGVGAWGTELNLNLDGTFSGRYDDTDMGDNTHYEAVFTGRFSNIRRVDALTYTMTLADLHVEGILGDSYWLDGMRHILSVPAGLQEGEAFTLHLPGSDTSTWPEDKKSWLYEQGPQLTSYYLYGSYSGGAFVPSGMW